ncbi:MAG: DUF885 domain-containing protein [Desulfobacteraceae bacterium]|nr:DUF885 family protein [Desulfobacteraceae bacterium]MBC2755729.1 DUF885 domain-containing protein [Desulfobacteraceae bacterium]
MQISDQPKHNSNASGINAVADSLFETLALRFPVCMASDEFHYYPQATIMDKDWSRWDDFSPESIADISVKLSEYKLKLDQFVSSELTFDEQVDISLLNRMINTIIEQLNEVQPHKTHPSFYLTIIGTGLVEAVEAGTQALNDRLKGLLGFIQHARQNLEKVHDIFKNQGCEMIDHLSAWIRTLPVPRTVTAPVIHSLERFNSHLMNLTPSDEFLVSKDLYEQIASRHMGCFMPLCEIERQIDNEISETTSVVEIYASEIFPEISWQKNIADLNFTLPHRRSVKQVYQACVSELANHCIQKGIVAPEVVKNCLVHVETVPVYMHPVRSNAAYSMPPGHPPQGGTFFIIESENNTTVASDYKLLTAHETYPGHHLLDTSRWCLKKIIRRHIEFPVFYEGWACISEELLFDTGFFHNSFDRMLSAKRRLWRAVRGKMDLEIHTRKKSLKEAAVFLSDYGMAYTKASELVRKYILKPGYQLSYAIGRYYFANIYESFVRHGGSPENFVCRVLSHGEVGFDHLSQFLSQEDVRE